jgi:hypothetical protein
VKSANSSAKGSVGAGTSMQLSIGSPVGIIDFTGQNADS